MIIFMIESIQWCMWIAKFRGSWVASMASPSCAPLVVTAIRSGVPDVLVDETEVLFLFLCVFSTNSRRFLDDFRVFKWEICISVYV